MGLLRPRLVSSGHILLQNILLSKEIVTLETSDFRIVLWEPHAYQLQMQHSVLTSLQLRKSMERAEKQGLPNESRSKSTKSARRLDPRSNIIHIRKAWG